MTTGGFEAALDYLTGEILAGRIARGDTLPTERDLSDTLQIGRGAVREAIKALQAQGVVTSQPGRFGGNRVATDQGLAFGRILKLHVALQAVSFQEITETRVVLERAAAVAAAGKPGLDRVRELAEHMILVQRPELFNTLDTQFHVAIADLGENRLIADITIAIREAVAEQILQAEQRHPNWEKLRKRLVKEHLGIVDALAEGDAELAADLCESHIRGAHADLG